MKGVKSHGNSGLQAPPSDASQPLGRPANEPAVDFRTRIEGALQGLHSLQAGYARWGDMSLLGMESLPYVRVKDVGALALPLCAEQQGVCMFV
jgi:hypothetical protein